RRHTRSKRDWSSDVCSSDLLPVRLANNRYEQFQFGIKRHPAKMDVTITADRESGKFEIIKGYYDLNGGGRANFSFSVAQVCATRSEERRVGKECRCRRGEW